VTDHAGWWEGHNEHTDPTCRTASYAIADLPPMPADPTDPATTPPPDRDPSDTNATPLLVALYPGAPPGIGPLVRFPTPTKRLLLTASTPTDLTDTILTLLEEGGIHGSIRITLASPSVPVA
jgi:hypothetical protein